MEPVTDRIEHHYARGDLLDSILGALREMGKDLTQLEPADLAPVDEFHAGGSQSTAQLAARTVWTPGLRVLDVGCGLGGPARYLASQHRCHVTGIDLTQEYVDVANALTQLVGLEHLVDVRRANALKLPFDDGSFDVVWTEHAQMNIADKHAFYEEITRVLKPGGRLLFHDIFQGDGGPPHLPVPWAADESISFLATPEQVRDILEGLGFSIHDWEDRSQTELDFVLAVIEHTKEAGPSPLGLQLLMGETTPQKIANVLENLRENRTVIHQALAVRH